MKKVALSFRSICNSAQQAEALWEDLLDLRFEFPCELEKAPVCGQIYVFADLDEKEMSAKEIEHTISQFREVADRHSIGDAFSVRDYS